MHAISAPLGQCHSSVPVTSALLVQAVKNEMFNEPVFCQQAMFSEICRKAITICGIAAAAPFTAHWQQIDDAVKSKVQWCSRSQTSIVSPVVVLGITS